MKILLMVFLLLGQSGQMPKVHLNRKQSHVQRKDHMPAAKRLQAYGEAHKLPFHSTFNETQNWCAYLDTKTTCKADSEGGLDSAVTGVIKLYEGKSATKK